MSEVGRVELERIEYAWVEPNDFLPVASSVLEREDREAWHSWLAGWQNLRQRAGVRNPSASRCFVRTAEHAAAVVREQFGPDSRRDIRITVLAGTPDLLNARTALLVEPPPRDSHPAAPGPDGIRPLPRYSVAPPPDELGRRLLADAVQPEITVGSPVSGLDPVRLLEPLAALVAGSLELDHRRKNAGASRNQLVLVGSDEPTARAMLYALGDILTSASFVDGFPTFSTFEAAHPQVPSHDRDPSLVFMPDFQPLPRGVPRPTAFVFLAPERRPAGAQILQLAEPSAAGDSAFERAARVLVRAYRIGGDTWKHLVDAGLRTPSGNPEAWASRLKTWEDQNPISRVPGNGSQARPTTPQDPAPPAGTEVAGRHLRSVGRDQPGAATGRGPRPVTDDSPRIAPGLPRPVAGVAKPGGDRGGASQPRPDVPGDTSGAAGSGVAMDSATAEALLREAISDFRGTPVRPDQHVADALVQAFYGRQWLSGNEAADLRAFLEKVLAKTSQLSLLSMGELKKRFDRPPKVDRVAPAAIKKLLDYANSFKGGFGHIVHPADVAERLGALLNTPLIDLAQLNAALDELIEIDTTPPLPQTPPVQRPLPDSRREDPAGKFPEDELPLSDPRREDTIRKFAEQVVKTAAATQIRINDPHHGPRADVLRALFEAVRDSFWLPDKAEVALEQIKVFRHLGLDIPSQGRPCPYRPDFLRNNAEASRIQGAAAKKVNKIGTAVQKLERHNVQGAGEVLIGVFREISETIGDYQQNERDEAIRLLWETARPRLHDPIDEANRERERTRKAVCGRLQILVDQTTAGIQRHDDPVAGMLITASLLPAAVGLAPGDPDATDLRIGIIQVWEEATENTASNTVSAPSPSWLWDRTHIQTADKESVTQFQDVARGVQRHARKAMAGVTQSSLTGVTRELVASLRTARSALGGTVDNDFLARTDNLHRELDRLVHNWEEQHRARPVQEPDQPTIVQPNTLLVVDDNATRQEQEREREQLDRQFREVIQRALAKDLEEAAQIIDQAKSGAELEAIQKWFETGFENVEEYLKLEVDTNKVVQSIEWHQRDSAIKAGRSGDTTSSNPRSGDAASPLSMLATAKLGERLPAAPPFLANFQVGALAGVLFLVVCLVLGIAGLK